MKLSEYAKKHNIKYKAAWNRFHAGKIPNAYLNELGRIVINEDICKKPENTAVYCSVSSSQNKENLEKQKERLVSYCAAKGYKVHHIICECASGLNDNRPKLMKLLRNDDITRIVVEHDDRLTRFGKNYLKSWMKDKGVEIEVINEANNDRDELMADFVSLVTYFTAKLYGQKSTKRKIEKLIKELEK